MEHPETEEHAGTCAVCRLERGAAMAMASASIAEPDDAARTERLIEAAVARRPARSRRTRAWVVLGVAAALLVAGAAGASIVRELGRAPLAATPEESLTVPHETAIDPIRGSKVELSLAPFPASSGTDQGATPVSPGGTSAAALFSQGNQQRMSGEPEKAIATYRRLVSTFPESAEGATARVSLGRLLLERGDGEAALAQYDSYLAGSDQTLREEALAGRAGALQRLGRREQERQAWRQLLKEFPSSLFADKARSRLE